MNRAAKAIQNKLNLQGILSSAITKNLARFEEELSHQLQTSGRFMQLINEHILSWKGKRLRPVLVLIMAEAYHLPEETAINLACAIEMIHTATLVHDDVVDEAKLRRFKPTVNHKWDNEIAILAGDYLFSQASYILAKEIPSQVTQLISLAVKDTCEGEIEQLCRRMDKNLSESEYFQILKKKTGSLFAVSCSSAAMLAELAEEEIQSLDAYGRNLGIAFQIIDDYLDFTSTSERLGKPAGNDFDNDKLTLSLIHTLREAKLRGEEVKDIFRMTKPEVINLANRYKSGDYCLNKAEEYLSQAKANLQTLRNQSVREILDQIADYVLQRDY